MPDRKSGFTSQFAFVTLSLFSSIAYSADASVKVLSYESVDVDFRSAQIAAAGRTTNSSTLRFTAFGRSFVANLEFNSRITVPDGARSRPYRGTIDGRENSWVRITKNGDEIHGLMFDGSELLAIEPTQSVDASASSGTAIFRLADTKTDLGAEFCSSSDAPLQTGAEMYSGLGNDSKKILSQLQSNGATKRLEISAVMDAAFRSRYASDAAANDAIVARVNNVDGIFSSQLGIEIAVTQIVQPESSGQVIFSGTNPDTLLQALSRVRSGSPALYGTGLTHLFTGIDMDGSTVGIAYINAVCSQQYSVSLGEARDRGVWFDSLVAAHEIGHTFGSPHDGTGQCAATPTTFLMAATINGSSQFSACSLGIMQARIPTASCLVSIPLADISLASSLGDYHAALNQSFDMTIAVSNVGAVDSQASRIELGVPAALIVSSAKVDGGTCTVGGGIVSCDLGIIAARASSNVNLTLSGSQSGTFTISASVSANTNLDTSNDISNATVRIDPSVDVAVSLNIPATADSDQTLSATFAVTNKSNVVANSLNIDITVPSGITLSGTAMLADTSCQTQYQTIHCTAASLGANQSLSGTFTLVAHDAGTQTISVAVDGSYFDPHPQDNSVQKSIAVGSAATSAPAMAQQPETKSGGGALSVGFLLALVFIAHRRRDVRANQSG